MWGTSKMAAWKTCGCWDNKYSRRARAKARAVEHRALLDSLRDELRSVVSATSTLASASSSDPSSDHTEAWTCIYDLCSYTLRLHMLKLLNMIVLCCNAAADDSSDAFADCRSAKQLDSYHTVPEAYRCCARRCRRLDNGPHVARQHVISDGQQHIFAVEWMGPYA